MSSVLSLLRHLRRRQLPSQPEKVPSAKHCQYCPFDCRGAGFDQGSCLLSLQRYCQGNTPNVDSAPVAGCCGSPQLSILVWQRPLIRRGHPQPHQMPSPVHLLPHQIIYEYSCNNALSFFQSILKGLLTEKGKMSHKCNSSVLQYHKLQQKLA